MRSIEELTDLAEPAWPEVLGWIADSPRSVQVLPVEEQGRCLHRLQVTTRSCLGALAWECGGLLLDSGWLRLLGGGTAQLPDVAAASGMSEQNLPSEHPPYLMVGHDVLGGAFAINGGGLPVPEREVAYFAPDSLRWEGLGMGHCDFVRWALTGNTEAFFADLRWDGWQAEAAMLSLDKGLSVWPPLWTVEGAGDIAATSRRPVPWAELQGLLRGPH